MKCSLVERLRGVGSGEAHNAGVLIFEPDPAHEPPTLCLVPGLHVHYHATNLSQILEAHIFKRVVGAIEVLEIGKQSLHKSAGRKALCGRFMPQLEESPSRPFLLGKRKRSLPFAEIQAAQEILVTAGNHTRFRIPLLLLNISLGNRTEIANQRNQASLL